MEIITSFVSILISIQSITILMTKSCYCMNFKGMEIMELDDLMLIPPTEEVGNLALGDECRNNGITDITEDVCFHSHPTFQCIKGQCKCALIRISNERVEQMVFENQKCKRLINWGCQNSTDCAFGLTCRTAPTKSEKEDNSQDEEDEDYNALKEQSRLNRLYPGRKRMKDKIKKMFAPNKTSNSKKTKSKSPLMSNDVDVQNVHSGGHTKNNKIHTRIVPGNLDSNHTKLSRTKRSSSYNQSNSNENPPSNNNSLSVANDQITSGSESEMFCQKSASHSILNVRKLHLSIIALMCTVLYNIHNTI